MQHRRVGHSGLEVSRLALGTMSWGATVDAFEAEDQLKTFLDADGTLVDTAPIYGEGSCEELLGTLLNKTGVRDQIVLAGKAGLIRRNGQTARDGSRGTLLDQLDLSLRQLQTDHLDLWQIHTPGPRRTPGGDARRSGARRSHGTHPLCRHLQLHRMADGDRSHMARGPR